MGLFSTSSSIEQAVDVATDGKKTSENWAEILEIVDQIEQQPNGAKESLKAIMKRVKHRDPHVGLLALTLLDACVANAKHKFHLEVSSRFFDDEVRVMLQNSQNYSREVVERFCMLIKKWSENEFKSDPALSIIPSLYNFIKVNRPTLVADMGTSKTAASGNSGTVARSTDTTVIKKKEEEDLAKAIALSIEEDKKKRSGSGSAYGGASSALYPSVGDSSSSNNTNPIYSTVNKQPKETRKVRAMYDFEAVEDNELTFKAGEILHVIDDSDANWWKGSNHRGEGLFPTNFVTSDLNYEPENEYAGVAKKKINDETSSVISEPVEHKPVTIDEALIDQTLNVIHDADPTGERADPADLLSLEDQCSRMWPLIDTELQKADRLQSSLDELSTQINDALAMYDNVMKEQATQVAAMPPYQTGIPANPPVQAGYYAQGPQHPAQYSHSQIYYPDQQLPGQIQPGVYAPSAAHLPQQSAQQPAYQPYMPNPAKLTAAGVGNYPHGQQQQAPGYGATSQQVYQGGPYVQHLSQQ